MKKRTPLVRVFALALSILLLLGMVPVTALAASFDVGVTDNYYTILSEKEYVLCDGAVEKDIVINNESGSRRQVLHVIEVDPNNTNVEILPAYYGIDKDLTDSSNWSAQTMEVQMDYYRDQLGYNVVAGMNTALAYDSEAPSSFLVYNGQVLATPELHGNSQTYLAVTKNEDGTVRCELRSTSEALHGDEWQAVSCNFGFVVKDGELVNKTVSRSDAADRSMIGIKEDGTLVIVQAEGRNAPYAVGLSSYELGETMLALGCKWAVNGDGGGSSQILTKREGESDYSLRNIPSDGTPRATINGIIIASKAAPSGVFDHVSMLAESSYITPNSSVKIDVKGVDAAGSAAELPAEGLTYTATSGTYADGVYTAGAQTGLQTITAFYNGEEVGAVTVEVVIPDRLEFAAPEITVPYGKSVLLDLAAYYGAFQVPITAADVTVALSNGTVGTVDGLLFTAVSEDVEDPSSEVVVTLVHNTQLTASATLTLGKGSEVVYDFEDQDLHGFYRGTSASYNYNNPTGETYIVDASSGHVRSGQYAMAVEVNFSNSLEAGYQLASLITGEKKVFENAKTLGMWLYIPDEADGLRIDLVINAFDESGNATANTTGQWAIAGAGEASVTEVGFVYSFDESGWYYISKDISAYTYNGFNEGVQLLKFYVSQKDGKNGYSYGDQSSVNGNFVFYVDDITVDYSSAVDDREAPIFSGMTYAVSGMDESVELDGQTVTSNTVSFIASVAENTARSNYTGINTGSGRAYIDGVDYTSHLTWTGNSKMSLNDVTLADGRHEVKFTVCDKQGNYTSIIRDIVVNSTENAPVRVVARNPEADRLLLGSVYYVDVVAAAVENVQSVTVTMDLNNISLWHLDNMDVAEGFEASYSLIADENIATVTITRTGKVTATGELALVSIPTRTWQMEPVVAIYGHAGKVWMYPDYKAGNEILPMDLTVETDGGLVTFTDGTTASFASPRIQVDTELSGNAYTSSGSAANNYIRNESWYADWNGGHDHRVETAQYYAEGATNVSTPVALPDKEATCTEDGYTGRTFCEDCQSVVDWGTTIPRTGHSYSVVDGRFVCECGDIYDLSGQNGLVELDGELYYAINGQLKSGWIVDGADYYYFDPDTYTAVDGQQTLADGYSYIFEDYKLVRGQLVTDSVGTRYRWAGTFVTTSWVELDGNKYYATMNGYFATGSRKVSNIGFYFFDEQGIWQENLSGLVIFEGSTYYLENGMCLYGLHEIEGDLYYFATSRNCAAVTGEYYVSNDNGLGYTGWQNFDEDGKLIKSTVDTTKTGIYTEDGVMYYYEQGVKTYAGLIEIDGYYYYVNSSCKVVTGRYYITKNNGLPYQGYYDFDEQGRLIAAMVDTTRNGIVTEDGVMYYYENGVKTYAGLIEIDGYYYYVNSACKVVTGRYYITKNNGLPYQGYYDFDEQGRLIAAMVDAAKTGIYTEDGVMYYYEQGVKTYAGLIEIDGYYYYVNSSCKVVTGRYYITKNNGLPYHGYQEFDDQGRLIAAMVDTTKTGIVTEDGVMYYYENGVKTYAGLIEIDGYYYYVNSSCKVVTGRYYITKNNGLPYQGWHDFDEQGRLILAD